MKQPTAAPENTPSNQTERPTRALSTNTSMPGRRYAPPLGTRIEVLWRIESGDTSHEEGGEIHDRWWGAVVQECTLDAGRASAIDPAHAEERVHVLLYDAYGEFEEDVASVVFLPNRTLVDVARLDDENKGVLDWRLEGEETRPQELSLNDVASEQRALVMEAGISENADLEALSAFPADVQIGVASGYRMFADGVKRMLGELVASKPAGYVVTEADVQTIFARIQQSAESDKNVQQAGM